MTNRAALALATLVAATLIGCSSTTTQVRYQERVIDTTDPDAVLMAAVPILQREFGHFATREGNRLVTAPAEYTTVRDSGTARDLYRGRSTMRRTGYFEVGRRGDRTVARLRIEVERQDTTRRQVMQPRGYRISDTPGEETPVMQDAATTHEQNTVWTPVRRDTSLERALLEELQEHFSRLATETNAAEATEESAIPRASEPAPPAETRE